MPLPEDLMANQTHYSARIITSRVTLVQSAIIDAPARCALGKLHEIFTGV